MEKSRKPKIRFKGYNDDWEQRKFRELYSKSGEKNDGSIGINKNITVATMQFKGDVKVSTPEYLKTYYTFNLGDIAFEGHQSKEFRYGRFVENDIGNGIVSHIFSVFRPVKEYDLHFWKYAINNEELMQHILSRSTKASTMMHDLVTDDFLNETFLVPSLSEQEKVGSILHNLDNLITLHQRKLEKLMNVKKSMLEKMFPKQGSVVPEIRFCGFTDAWEQRELGDCSEIFLGLTYTPKYVDEGKIFISSKDIAKDYLDLSEPKYISEEEFNRSSENAKPKKGDILFTRVGSNLGHPVIIETKEKLCIFVSLGYLRPLNFVHNYYMKYWMCSPDFKTQIFQKTGGGAKVNVNTGWLRKFSFQFSKNIEEQIQIGVFFKNIDNLITLHQRKLEKLKNIKKSMLEKMFI